jgi:hypothetical protein
MAHYVTQLNLVTMAINSLVRRYESAQGADQAGDQKWVFASLNSISEGDLPWARKQAQSLRDAHSKLLLNLEKRSEFQRRYNSLQVTQALEAMAQGPRKSNKFRRNYRSTLNEITSTEWFDTLTSFKDGSILGQEGRSFYDLMKNEGSTAIDALIRGLSLDVWEVPQTGGPT